MSNDILDILNIKNPPGNDNAVYDSKSRQMGWVIAIFGLALIFISQTQRFTKTGRIHTDEIREDTGTKNLLLYSGIIALIVGGIVAVSSNKSRKNTVAIEENIKSAPIQGDAIEQLEKLDSLRKKGIITEEEFADKKKEILSKI